MSVLSSSTTTCPQLVQVYSPLPGFSPVLYIYFILSSPSWWKRIISVRIFSPNPTISTMNNKFRFLISCYFPCSGNSLRLCIGFQCSFLISCTNNLPTSVSMRSNMLIFTHTRPPYSLGKQRRLSLFEVLGEDFTYFSLLTLVAGTTLGYGHIFTCMVPGFFLR